MNRIRKREKSNSISYPGDRSIRSHTVNHSVADDIELKLQQINKRMIRSSENHQKLIKEKVQRIRVYKHKRILTLDNYEELVRKIADKHIGAETRRARLKEETFSRASSKESQFLEKVKIMQSTQTDTKALSLKEKERRTKNFLVRIKLKQRNEIESRHKKLKDIEDSVTQNILRQKKILNMKKEKIIEKHFGQRFKQMEAFESTSRRSKDRPIKFVMKKERFHAPRISLSLTPERKARLLQTV